jgi:hypothetical protein
MLSAETPVACETEQHVAMANEAFRYLCWPSAGGRALFR